MSSPSWMVELRAENEHLSGTLEGGFLNRHRWDQKTLSVLSHRVTQVPSTAFSWQRNWNGLPLPSPEDLLRVWGQIWAQVFLPPVPALCPLSHLAASTGLINGSKRIGCLQHSPSGSISTMPSPLLSLVSFLLKLLTAAEREMETEAQKSKTQGHTGS